MNQQRAPCQCLHRYTKLLCHLQLIGMRQQPVQIGTILTCKNQAIATAEYHLGCAQCKDDSRVWTQLTMVIQTVMSWIQIQMQRQPLHTPLEYVKATVGQHHLTKDEPGFVTNALLSRAMQRIQRILDCLTAIDEQIILCRLAKQSRMA